MGKRKSQALLDDSDGSDSNGSGSVSGSDLEKEMLSLSKKKKNGAKKLKEGSDDSDSSDSDIEWSSKNKSKKKKVRPAKVTSRRSSSKTYSSDSEDHVSSTANIPVSTPKKSSDLEEGEVSSSEFSDSSPEEFNDGYDDNLMGDEEDRNRLNAMNEKEREQEIFKRIEQREAMKTRFEIEKKLKQARKKELKRQRKLELAMSPGKLTVDVKERSKERKKTVENKVDKKSQAMDALKEKREAKKQRAEEKERIRIEQEKIKEEKVAEDDLEFTKDDTTSSATGERSNKKKLKASDIYSDDSGSDWEDEDRGESKVKKESSSDSRSGSDSEREERRQPRYVDKVEDLNKIRISRFKMEKWVHLPFFSKVLKGAFVRVGIGVSHAHGAPKSVYRIGEILEVAETAKVYTIGQTRTNKGIRIRHGTDEKVFRFEFVSNSDFTQDEFQRWKDVCSRKSIAIPTMEDIDKKIVEIKEANDYQFKEEDIEHIIQEKKKFHQTPINFAAKKTALIKERQDARDRNDDARAKEIDGEIQELDERAKELDKLRTSSISSISYINERNRKKNVEQAEKALLEELKDTKGKVIEDPFTRRNTKPTILRRAVTETFQTLENEVKEEPEDQVDRIIVPTEPKIELPKVPKPSQNITAMLNLDLGDLSSDDIASSANGADGTGAGDLFSAHDFDIKLDLDPKLPPNLPIVARPSSVPMREPAPRRSLNLDDYKRKRGLI